MRGIGIQNTVKEKKIITFIKVIRQIYIQDYCHRGDKSISAPNTAKTASLMRRVRESMVGKLLRGIIKGREILAKLTRGFLQ